MRKLLFIFILLIFSLSLFAKYDTVKTVKTDWLFIKDEENTGLKQGFFRTDYDTSEWQKMPVNVYWEDVIGKYDGFAWYKRTDSFTKEELKAYKYIYLDFRGVSDYCWVYVNGKEVYVHTPEAANLWPGNCRIWPFAFDIKKYLKEGENQICLRVENVEKQGGIYKPVKYIFTDSDIENPVYKSIAELNPDFSEYINQALKPKNSWSGDYTNPRIPFSLLFATDIHEDTLEISRWTEFYSRFNDKFDDFIMGGDQVSLAKSTGFEFWGKIKGAEKILFVLGNHEALENHHPMDWSKLLNGKESFDYYFKPYIKNWNVIYKEGCPYFYKDYPDKKVRLIGLDSMLFDSDMTEQMKWLDETLEGARNKKYTVLICSHFPPKTKEFVKIKCAFSTVDDPMYQDLGKYRSAEAYREAQKSVDSFIKKGGSFAAWLCGHDHRDCLSYDEAYPNQLVISLDCASRDKSLYLYDTCRTNGEKSMDLGETIVVDTKANVLKIVRVGADRDMYLRKKDAMAINYKIMKVIE